MNIEQRGQPERVTLRRGLMITGNAFSLLKKKGKIALLEQKVDKIFALYTVVEFFFFFFFFNFIQFLILFNI